MLNGGHGCNECVNNTTSVSVRNSKLKTEFDTPNETEYLLCYQTDFANRIVTGVLKEEYIKLGTIRTRDQCNENDTDEECDNLIDHCLEYNTDTDITCNKCRDQHMLN